MLGRANGKADHCRQCRKDRSVTGATRDQDINPGAECPLKRTHSHLTDDVGGGVNFGSIERRHVVDRSDAICLDRPLQHTTVYIGLQYAQTKMETFLTRDLSHNGESLLEMRLGPRRSGGPNDKRDI